MIKVLQGFSPVDIERKINREREKNLIVIQAFDTTVLPGGTTMAYTAILSMTKKDVDEDKGTKP
jgi:hypothetical protein